MIKASWRSPYGQTGILEFFLRVVATEDIDHDIMLHSLRLVGNACADTGMFSSLRKINGSFAAYNK